MVTLDDVKNDFDRWSDWKVAVDLGQHKSSLDATVVDYSGVSSGTAQAGAIVPVAYLDKSGERRVQIIESCFELWEEERQRAVIAKYLLPSEVDSSKGVVMLDTERSRLKWMAQEMGCSIPHLYKLIHEAHLMVLQVHHFKRWDLL